MPSAEARYARAVDAAFAAARAPGQWPAALTAIANYVGGSGAMLVGHNLSRGEHWQMVGGLDPDLSRLYLDRYADNFISREVMRRGPGLYAAHELANLADFRRTPFLADIWEPQRIETMLQMAHPALTVAGASGGFAVSLTARHIDDLPRIERRWKRIATPLRLSADLYLARYDRERQTQVETQYLELLPDAAFISDAQGHILSANREGQALLEQGIGLRSGRNSTLCASNSDDNLRLRKALFAAAMSTRAPSCFRMTDPDRLLLIISPAPELEGRERIVSPGRALVRAIDIGARHHRQAETASRLFELSPAETKVLARSVEGVTAPDVAKALGVSVSTVRTHLKHIFEKTRVHSQTELAQLVARLPTLGEH